MEAVIRLLQELIAIPSVNPCFADGTGEEEIAGFLEGYARKAGLDVQRQAVADRRDNLLFWLHGRSDETILLETHTDTVTTEGMTILPFDPQVKDGKVFGRGACDAKASLSAMLQAMVEVAKRGTPSHTVVLAAVVDEENDFHGIQKLVKSDIRADFAVVGEPTDLRIVVAHKGTVRGFISTQGISAHSAQPERGVNAILNMAKVVLALERYDAELRMRHHPLVGSPTLAVSMVKGGRGMNLVPDFCEIGIDRRTLPKEDPLIAWEEIRRFLQSQPELLNLSTEISEPTLAHWGMEVGTDSLPAQRLASACQKVSVDVQFCGVHYTSDASKLVMSGIPTVVFGPGSITQAHTTEEWVDIEQVFIAQKIFETLIAG